MLTAPMAVIIDRTVDPKTVVAMGDLPFVKGAQ